MMIHTSLRPMRSLYRGILLSGLLLVLMSVGAFAASTDPIRGVQFDSLIASQHVEVQAELETIFPETDGYLITGPLDPLFHASDDVNVLYHELRVICPDLATLNQAVDKIKDDDRFGRIKTNIDKTRGGDAAGFRGVTAEFRSGENVWPVQFTTTNQTRWLLWARENLFGSEANGLDEGDLEDYARAVSDHLLATDQGNADVSGPDAKAYNLPDHIGLYEPPPDYVIDGYQNYKDYLYSHAAIETEFADGVLSFVPSDSLVSVLIDIAPQAAYPNKEAPMLQHEYRKFFGRDGTVRTINTLSPHGFDTLTAGEYFFAVGVNGKVRFGRELLREEVERIEQTTGKKVPRANHAFLFPGEPVLVAGAFVIVDDDNGHPHIRHINAQSGHYFYSNVTPTVREDIALHSNEYFLTLGHFLDALVKMEIPFDSVLISKL